MGDGEAVNNSSGGGIGGGIDAAAAAARSMAVDDEDGIQWRQQHSTMTVMKAKERR
jgi:flavin-dependent dehydrogenase